MDLGEIELGDNIDQEEDQVILRELGGRCVGLVGVKFGCPGTIGFGTRRVHDRSQVRMGEDQSSSSPHVKVTLTAKPSQSSESATCFMDSLLGSQLALPDENSQPASGPGSGLLRRTKGDVLNCRGKVHSLRKACLPGSCSSPEQLRMSPSRRPLAASGETNKRVLLASGCRAGTVAAPSPLYNEFPSSGIS